MFTGEPTASSSQVNDTHFISSLLKNQDNLSERYFSQDFDLESSDSRNFVPGQIEQPSLHPNSELLSHLQGNGDSCVSEGICLENSDNSNDFNYSQKLFHIADGNLYSIFSPIQGRSYGMKPSFLRRQKYTVQECHSRGRRNFRKGLKFHNFLPSESTTSEKDASHVRTRWKIHSECRLREEHGTKQITISNWSQSSAEEPEVNSRSEKNDCVKPSTKLRFVRDIVQNEGEASDPYDFNLSLQNNCLNENGMGLRPSTATTKPKDSIKSVTSKKDLLSCVVNSLLDKPSVRESKLPACDDVSDHSKSFYHNQKHRRKPVQTRRVVPYVKYLSIMEENESVPLDLSSKCCSENNPFKPEEESQNILRNSLISASSCCDVPIKNVDKELFSSMKCNRPINSNPKGNLYVNSSLADLLQSQIPPPLQYLAPPIKSDLNFHSIAPLIQSNNKLSPPTYAEKIPSKPNPKQFKIKNWLPPPNINPQMLPSHSSSQFNVNQTFMKESRSRRRNQRSVIKQKLEDTFKQNGFLVKTKQVSDGEATFCKFRQLRKYTRYYLKSWQQHLPDEVHKMWKGFLPPKTVLPPTTDAGNSANVMPQ